MPLFKTSQARRLWLSAAAAVLVTVGLGGLPTYQQWTGRLAHERVTRETLERLFHESRKRERMAAQAGDFEAAEAYLYCLLSLSESVDAARLQYGLHDLPDVEPNRLAKAYNVAHQLADGPENRRRLRSLEERYDDRIRELLLARSVSR